MIEKIVTLTVDKNGNPTIEVRGIKGPACLALTKELEEALGSVSSRRHTPEYTQLSGSTSQAAKLGG